MRIEAALCMMFAGVALAQPGPGGAGAPPGTVGGKPYEKLDSREATEKHMMDVLVPVRLEWGPWSVLAAFPIKGIGHGEIREETAFESEIEQMRPGGAGPDLAASYKGVGGLKASWRRLGDITNGATDLNQFCPLGHGKNVVAYLYGTVTAPEATSIDVTMGSDDGVRFWCNGKLLVDDDAVRGLEPDQIRTRLQLVKGVNHLLAKVSQGDGDFTFQINRKRLLDSRTEAQLNYLLDLDFPTTPEAEYYRVFPISLPDNVVLEVGGMDTLPDGRPIVCTRRGDIYIIDHAYDEPASNCTFTRFATGLHEPLGLCVRIEGASDGNPHWCIYCTQRGELTRLTDTDGDNIADLYETVCAEWGVSGNYHEFAFGPKFDRDGNAWVTLNVGFCDSLGKSVVPWRGWSLKIGQDGHATPISTGLRSPNGIGQWLDGTMFYLDNQGDFVGTNRLAPLVPGGYAGHPAGLRWREGWKAGDQPPPITPATVWFPYKKTGQSIADFLLYAPDSAGGLGALAGFEKGRPAPFGPFANQVFVGDQMMCWINRVTIEKVDDVYQGACYPFRQGFQCGLNRLCWGKAGSMFVGETDRGWGSIGRQRYGVERVAWTGKVPFELQEMKAAHDGFVLTFTKDVDASSATDAASYAMTSYTYEHHARYGSDEMETQTPKITAATLIDSRTVHLVVDGLRAGGMGYVHELTLPGVRSAPESGKASPLLHPIAYYTLQRKPG